MRFDRPRLLAILALLTGCFQLRCAAPEIPDRFGIYIAELSGKNLRTVATSSWQQLSHPRVSPDHAWITFTRYTHKGWDGLARENGNYGGTEVMLVRPDGSDMQVLIPPKEGILNCVSSWIDGGRSIIWLSTDNADRTPSIMKIDMATRAISRLPTPKDFKTTDPNSVGNRLIFPVIGKEVDSLWTMKMDGSGLEQVTHPPGPVGFRFGAPPAGDFDPKLSPDGKKAAFMRLTGRSDWRVWVVDLATHEEKKLSGPDDTDIVPDWSSDGRLLIFSHIDTEDLHKMGLYTIKPDGTDRQMLPLPGGQVFNQAQFFPGEGSGPQTRIIYQTMKIPDVI